MPILITLLTLLVGSTIALLPLSTGFFPRLGLTPLKLGQRSSTRLVQVILVWMLAATTLWIDSAVWGWIAGTIAIWFTVVALNFYPQRIFVALTRPARAQEGLTEAAPVLAVEEKGEVVAYPFEMIVPHHVVNDVVGGRPVLVAW